MTDSIQQRVARGAQWLDEVRPGWRDSINLGQFDIRDSHQCACGQTFAGDALAKGGMSGYWFALGLLQPDWTQDAYVESWDYGFLWDASCADDVLRQAEADALNEEWCRVIHQGREVPTHPATQREAVKA